MRAEGQKKNYHRATLLNQSTGEREEIVLIDAESEDWEHLFACDTQLELRADLTKALSPFTKAQRLILSRVLLQGQSIEEASATSRRSCAYWQKWLKNKALPYLRERLSDYMENGKLVLR